MHCLGAVSSGSASPQRAGNCGSVLGVVRALGVLVSEGRVQGPPRGYKEGPHCAAPLQQPANNHVCEKDNYLCDRYVILVREITDRVNARSYLCVEVLLCTDCPCGLAKATCKDPVLPIPSMSITPWQQSSEMLLEYWCISVVPSKGPEMMNNQSLYQAVRSRLHFSQVAAWWSRSKGAAPSYITTRLVSYSEDNLRKFRETPSEHTFPSAACGDGYSIKVTVWALPRIEDVPILNCPIHPASEKEDEGAARASTPTKSIPVPVTTTNPESLVLPTLVDDRLQTPCNEPGKHHCRCEEEDGCPPSPSLRANGERKRRRSLPRGPDFIPSTIAHTSTAATSVLPSVCELTAREHENIFSFNAALDCTSLNYNEIRYSASGPNNLTTDANRDRITNQVRCSTLPFFNHDEQSNKGSLHFDNQMKKNGCENGDSNSEGTFGLPISIQEHESNVEKRYKCSIESSCDNKPYSRRRERSPKLKEQQSNNMLDQSSSFTTAHFVAQNSMENINRTTSTISGKKDTECWGNNKKEKSQIGYIPGDTLPIIHSKGHFLVNPFNMSSTFHESNPGPSTYIYNNDRSKFQTSLASLSSNCDAGDKNVIFESLVQNGNGDELVKHTDDKKSLPSNNDLSHLMSKLEFPAETQDRVKDDKGILNWISKVPSRVFNVATNDGYADYKSEQTDFKLKEYNDGMAEVKSKQNCNLELSQREFNEVLAVLRARTPAGRRRTQMRTIKRRDKIEKQQDEWIPEQRSEFRAKPGSNFNTSDYPIHNNNVRNKTVVTDRLGILKLHGDGNGQSLVPPEKCEGIETLCENMGKVVHPHKLIEPQCLERSPWVSDGKFVSKDTDEGNNQCETLEAQVTNSAKCFYNVTNKADVLLGAILRTSKESEPRKGLLDISNGARPRTVLSSDNCNRKSYVYIKDGEKGKKKNGGVKPFQEDDRSLPSSLNKRICQLKQLFKKEQDKTDCEALNPEEYCRDHFNSCQTKSSVKNSKESSSRVKRRIDFSNIIVSSSDFNESLATIDDTRLSTNSMYLNPLFNRINYNTQNSSPMKIKENSLLPTNKEAAQISPNSLKRSRNLKLQIGCREIENGCINHQENCKNCDSVFSQQVNSSMSPINDSEKQNYVLPKVQEHQNYTDLEINDAYDRGVPSVIEQERFRRSLGNAASMVFHSRTGLPLTSSPAPLRRGSCCFDYDSSLISVSSKRSALFELNTPPSPGAVSLEEGDREAENICEGEEMPKRRTPSRGLPHSHALLGSFEESALNGRLEPVSTVHGFTAELGASGSFCPKHKKLPVTVFFYTLGDNDKVSAPYLAHINLGKKGYQVPRSGTIQVTLLNPLGTVVKMFVVMYDLSDMPSRSHTFLRQRTLRDKTLRYLIHLRFMSGKSGRIYLHTDIRMIICRKSDVDTASDLGAEPPKELRSFVHGPTNPKFSPRC